MLRASGEMRPEAALRMPPSCEIVEDLAYRSCSTPARRYEEIVLPIHPSIILAAGPPSLGDESLLARRSVPTAPLFHSFDPILQFSHFRFLRLSLLSQLC